MRVNVVDKLTMRPLFYRPLANKASALAYCAKMGVDLGTVLFVSVD